MMLLGDVGMAESWEVIKLMGGMALFWVLLGCFTIVLRWQYRLKQDSQMPVVVEEENVVPVDTLFKRLLKRIKRRRRK